MKKYQYNYTINIYCGCESGTTYFEPSLRRGFLLSESAIFVLSVVNALIVPPAPLPGGATSAL